jgi:hypothetical protein
MNYHVQFEVFLAVTTKNTNFWVVIPCRSKTARRFGATCHFHDQYRRISQAWNQQKQTTRQPKLDKHEAKENSVKERKDILVYFGFEVFRVVILENMIVWVLPQQACRFFSAGFLFFYPEDGNDTFLRNVRLSQNHTALKPEYRTLQKW